MGMRLKYKAEWRRLFLFAAYEKVVCTACRPADCCYGCLVCPDAVKSRSCLYSGGARKCKQHIPQPYQPGYDREVDETGRGTTGRCFRKFRKARRPYI